MKRKFKPNKKKKGWLNAIIIGFLIMLISMAGWSLWEIWYEYNLPAEEVVLKATEKTLNYDNYQFTAQAMRENADEKDIICTLKGEVNDENTYLSGEINLVGSKFEIYQIGDDYYRRDDVNGKWLMIDNLGKEAIKSLIAEIDPLEFLQFSLP